jgi:FG-GAP repeat
MSDFSLFRRVRVGSPAAVLVAPCAALAFCACNWSDFDKLEEEAPVVSIDAASAVRVAFGRSLASDPRNGRPTLLVGGQPGTSAAAAYEVGTSQKPGTDPTEDGFCSGGRVTPCMLADQPAPVRLVNIRGELDSCFAYGWGKDHSARNNGIVARCKDSSDITLPVPTDARKDHDADFNRDGEHQPLFLASDRFDENTLVAGLPAQQLAWFYPAGSDSPLGLELPAGQAPPKTYGGQLAILPLDEDGNERLIAVAAPGVGQVHLFRSVGNDSAQPLGCLGDGFAFGRALATGDVDGDGTQDLVVSDEQLVTAFSGAVLGALPEAVVAACSLSALPAGALLTSFGCGSMEAADGCARSDFGAALSVADLDGDEDGEIIVGAPGLEVYGVRDAGAVLVYDAEGDDPHELSDVLFASDPETDDRLGFSLATVPQKGRDIVAAGAPGRSQVDLFFCNELLPDKARTGRCAP